LDGLDLDSCVAASESRCKASESDLSLFAFTGPLMFVRAIACNEAGGVLNFVEGDLPGDGKTEDVCNGI